MLIRSYTTTILFYKIHQQYIENLKENAEFYLQIIFINLHQVISGER